ncbi:MAG: S9 family peptidase [Planctomycetota bacterium]|jgi:dipeptidyl-peptidase-4
MRALLLACLLPVVAFGQEITLDRALSRPEGRLPHRFRFLPGEDRIAYLKERDDKDHLADLWVYDIASKKHEIWVRAQSEQTLTPEEKAAKERRRDKTRGIGGFRIHPQDGSVLLSLSGELYRFHDGKLDRLTRTRGSERTPRWSPDGEAVAYYRDANLFVRRGGQERKVTFGGGGPFRCGIAEFIAMEELGRHEGFWWSRDSERLAYVRTGTMNVPDFVIHDYLNPRGKSRVQTYPRAGDTNVKWWLRVVSGTGGIPKTMPVSGEYLVRVDWAPDGSLYAQVANRGQERLDLYRCDVEKATAELVLHESDPRWVEFHDDLVLLEDGRFIWTSERSGRRHVYVSRTKEKGLTALTNGPWDVARVLGVDETRGWVHFTGSRESPAERHLYRVKLDGTGLERLTGEPGWHQVSRSPEGHWFIDTYSRVDTPPRIMLRDADGKVTAELAGSREIPRWPAPEFMTVPADDGTPLRAMLYRARKPGKRPALVYCYGGPGSHLVRDRWGGSFHLWHARMALEGYSVFVLDNRGCGGYGLDFSRAVDGRLCDWEVRDQRAGARWLGAQEFVDKERIGIWGWSYGGTLTLMCLLHAPEFRAGVSVAPVTDWRDYDTAYTERYLGLPKDNAEGYALSSPVSAAPTLSRPTLLVHGVLDDNVHFRNAVNFVKHAKAARRFIETDYYARGKHGIADPADRKALFSRMESFWAAHLR